MKGYFSILELTRNNTEAEKRALSASSRMTSNLADIITILNTIREHLHAPVRVTSLYRDPVHNSREGGSPTSQHLCAAAVDIASEKGLAALLDAVQKTQHDLQTIGQVIVYNNKKIIHVALSSDGDRIFPYSITFN